MEKIEILLSDHFVTFSTKIKEIHESKQQIKTEMKKIYEETQSRIKILDKQALELQTEFEKWKKDSSLNTGDG